MEADNAAFSLFYSTKPQPRISSCCRVAESKGVCNFSVFKHAMYSFLTWLSRDISQSSEGDVSLTGYGSSSTMGEKGMIG